MVNCLCNLDICHLTDTGTHDYDIPAHKGLKLCLPPELNTHTANASQLDTLQHMSEDEFKNKVNEFCVNQAKNIFTHIAAGIYSATYGFCAEAQCAIDDDPTRVPVECFAQATDGKAGDPATSPEPTCESPCGDVECDFSSTGNCSLSQVEVDHDIHPENCQCNKISTGACGDSTPTGVFCGPMPGMSDPPQVFSNPIADIMIKPIEIDIDPTASYLKMKVSPGAESDEHTVSVHGIVSFYGEPCPGKDCDLMMGMSLYPEDFDGANHFHYTVAPDEYITNLSIFGGTQSRKAHFHADGTGTITMGDLQLIAHANQREDGALSHKQVGYVANDTNPKDANFSLPLIHDGIFTLGPASISGGDDLVGANGTLFLKGRIRNLPPTARAATYPVLECTSPEGAEVVLDASASTDPDGDTLSWVWFRGGPFDTKLDTRGSHATTIAPIGTTEYSVTAADTGLLVSHDKTSVTVTDSTAPSIVGTLAPDCLWPPDHSMVLYAIGDGLDVRPSDACDAAPSLRIVNVVSNQPSLGSGSGSSAPDVVFGDAAFCVRAERDGTTSADRVYTVTVESKDHAGNVAQQDFTIRVPHDQRGAKCDHPADARIVADGDPRCAATLPPARSPVANAVLSTVPVDDARADARPAGCSVSGRAADASGWWAMGMLILIGFVRRLRGTIVLLFVLVVGAAACGQSSKSTADCLQGWWRDAGGDACLCPAQPECSASDCVASSFIGFEKGSYHEGTYTWSAAAKTMSSEGSVTVGTFSVSGNQLILTRSTGEQSTFTVSCSAGQMSLNGATRVRMSTSFATSLASAASSSTSWKGTPVSATP
jgi:hypothetical protein